MITIKHRSGDQTTRVTFSLDHPGPVSVIGDFNRWDPYECPLKKRSNGLRSVTVEVPLGTEMRFRYLADGGAFFDDADAEWVEPNGYGGTHGVIVAAIPPT